MNEVMAKITGLLGPAGSGALGHALMGLLILVVGLIVVKIIAGILGSILSRMSFLKRGDMDLVKPIKGLIKAVLTIFVLIAVLQHFGLTEVLAPLKSMVNDFLAAIPNIIGAGVVGYAGYIISKVVSELVGTGLNTVDNQIAERFGKEDLKISKPISTLLFALILLPVLVAALGVLNIPSISEPASAMITQLLDAIPRIIGAGIILAVAYFVVKFVVSILTALLDSVNVNDMPAKFGMGHMFSENFTPTGLIGSVVTFFAMLTAATAAVETLGIELISNIFAKVIEFGGGILIGGVIIVVGMFLGNLAHTKLTESAGAGMANIARFAILGLVLAMGLKAMGLADEIVNLAFGLTLGAMAVAAAVAFGMGGRDAAKTLADSWAEKLK